MIINSYIKEFEKLGFGMFVHFGLYSLLEQGEWSMHLLPVEKDEYAKLAKQLGLDAIHDTVHEMARDEARHGKAFAGLLARYFGK